MSLFPDDTLARSDRVECDNCEWTGSKCDLNDIQDPDERLSAGAIVPAGECPECGALAFLVDLQPYAPRILDESYLRRLQANVAKYEGLVTAQVSDKAVTAGNDDSHILQFKKGLAVGASAALKLVLEHHGLFEESAMTEHLAEFLAVLRAIQPKKVESKASAAAKSSAKEKRKKKKGK